MEAAETVDKLNTHGRWHHVGAVRGDKRVRKARAGQRHWRGGAPTSHGPGVHAAAVADGAREIRPEADERRNPHTVLRRVTEHTRTTDGESGQNPRPAPARQPPADGPGGVFGDPPTFCTHGQ